MYETVYDAMVEAKVARELDEPVWRDKSGNIITDRRHAYGRRSRYEITHPDYILFVDEVGGNMKVKGDGHNGGERFVCKRGTIPQQQASTNNNHFTVLPFTAANGEPVMCAIIFEGKEGLKAEWETGIDMFAIGEGTEDDPDYIITNSGEGKALPGGPKCTFRGKEIPCTCFFLPNGSVTSEILTSCLRIMDSKKLFTREDGRVPFLLLDGHGSCIELEFLNYIHDPAHEWKVCIGVPYSTSYWQLGRLGRTERFLPDGCRLVQDPHNLPEDENLY